MKPVYVLLAVLLGMPIATKPGMTERERDVLRKAEKRSVDRDLAIPEPLHPDRRAECEADDKLWLKTYCAEVFYNPFTAHQERIIEDCREVLLYGTQKCKAAPRGDGKSSIVRYLVLKYAICRQVRFPLIIAATSGKANDMLAAVKRRLASLATTALSEDYPLETYVARYVNPWPSRGRNVTANGRRPILVEWGADTIMLPTWADEESVGPIIKALGITSDELQGCNLHDQRPDFVMLDDLDSRDSLAAVEGVIAGKIEETIDKTVAGLGGQGRQLGKFMLCTITSRKSAAYKYSSPSIKPAWSGERIPALISWPMRTDLWAQYMELRRWGKETFGEDGRPVDPFGRKAHQLYVENREAMDEGAALSNPYNYESKPLPDGTPKQISALQRCYDYIADEGMASFLTEHQNDPPEDTGLVESGINVRLVQSQVSGCPRGVVPEGCTVLVQGVDIGKRYFHWVVRAFKPDGTGYTIDYDRQIVHGTTYGSEVGLDRAIKAAILQRMAEFRDMPYAQQFRESLTLFDSGFRTEAVYAACLEAGMGVMPVKAIGQSKNDHEVGRFQDVMRRTRDKKPICDGVYFTMVREPGTPPFYLVCASADQWKAWEHDRWMTARDKPGCMFLWGEASDDPALLSPDQRFHELYGEHICGEVEVEEEQNGVLRRRWLAKTKEIHWRDASYYADVAAAIKGIRIHGKAPVPLPSPTERPTMAQLAGKT